MINENFKFSSAEETQGKTNDFTDHRDTLTKLYDEARVICGGLDRGAKEEINQLARHPLDAALSVGISAGIGATLAIMQRKAGPIKLAGEILGGALGISFMADMLKPGRLNTVASALSDTWKTNQHIEENKSAIATSMGQFTVHTGLALGGGALGAGLGSGLRRLNLDGGIMRDTWSKVTHPVNLFDNKLNSPFDTPQLAPALAEVRAGNATLELTEKPAPLEMSRDDLNNSSEGSPKSNRFDERCLTGIFSRPADLKYPDGGSVSTKSDGTITITGNTSCSARHIGEHTYEYTFKPDGTFIGKNSAAEHESVIRPTNEDDIDETPWTRYESPEYFISRMPDGHTYINNWSLRAFHVELTPDGTIYKGLTGIHTGRSGLTKCDPEVQFSPNPESLTTTAQPVTDTNTATPLNQ